MLIQAEGYRLSPTQETQALYRYDTPPVQKTAQCLTFIPWFSWANRGEGEMRIWVNDANAPS